MAATIPDLMLGTAMWGWTVNKSTCFALLEQFYRSGYRKVDGATNYPIDKDPRHFRWAEQTLIEWINAHGIHDLEVNMKVGSLNNLKSPEHNLSKSFLLMNLEDYQQKFGNNLYGLMVHWDNRSSEAEIHSTMEALSSIKKKGVVPGLSGIRHPQIYARLNHSFHLDFDIQIKHNLLKSDYQRYLLFHGKRCFFTYGMNAGGLKLDPQAYRKDSSLRARSGQAPPPVNSIKKLIAIKEQPHLFENRPVLTKLNEFGMINAFYQQDVKGMLLGASRPEQLKSSLDFYQVLMEYDYSDIFRLQKSRDF